MNEQTGVSRFGFTNGCSEQLASYSTAAEFTRYKQLVYDNKRVMASMALIL